eukprot:CAMPEP_0206014228 /NCGR_PEP_ID=MMETSP1464-20131121/17913_1 /ASSEMBLY_ACC=CAM_ASM_001124 /TAXON_ID=119497 /ORGANISM="Exanthemachrysis gayraliae, Strain RCC1523" /LENGTH=124 /DNA_ID=CAMNT_0053387973 /DNA_START=36 /DNA_END=410 /DNA_ORIENTATION=+
MEALFSPSAVGREEDGLSACVLGAIAAAPIDARRDLYASIVLSGGTSLAPGLEARLLRDVDAATPSTVRVKVISNPARETLSWQGASLLSSLPEFASMWVTRAEYEQQGAACVHARCAASHPGS